MKIILLPGRSSIQCKIDVPIVGYGKTLLFACKKDRLERLFIKAQFSRSPRCSTINCFENVIFTADESKIAINKKDIIKIFLYRKVSPCPGFTSIGGNNTPAISS